MREAACDPARFVRPLSLLLTTYQMGSNTKAWDNCKNLIIGVHPELPK